MGVYKMDLRKMTYEIERWTEDARMFVYTLDVPEMSTENCKVSTMIQNNEMLILQFRTLTIFI